jgi:hypothetical protein
MRAIHLSIHFNIQLINLFSSIYKKIYFKFHFHYCVLHDEMKKIGSHLHMFWRNFIST